MALHCANKNHADFKKMAELYGEDAAYAYWDLHEGLIPDSVLNPNLQPTNPRDEVVEEQSTLEDVIQTLKQYVPGLDVRTQLRFVKNLQTSINGSIENIYGKVKDGIITLRSSTHGNVPKRAVAHEAMHVVWDYLLDSRQRSMLTTALNKVYNVNEETAPEKMSELFENYSPQNSSIPRTIKRFINNLFSFFNYVMFSDVYIDNFMERVTRGKYAGLIDPQGKDSINVERHMKSILRNFRDPATYSTARQIVLAGINSALDKVTQEGSSGVRVNIDGESFKLQPFKTELGSVVQQSLALAHRRVMAQLKTADPTQVPELTRRLEIVNLLLSREIGEPSRFVFEAIINDILPSIAIQTDIESLDEIIEDEDENGAGISLETQDVATIDPYKSSSGSIKEFFATVYKLDPLAVFENRPLALSKLKNQFENAKQAFHVGLEMFEYAFTPGMSNDVLLRRLKKYANEENSSLIAKAVYQALEELLTSQPLDSSWTSVGENSSTIKMDWLNNQEYVYVEDTLNEKSPVELQKMSMSEILSENKTSNRYKLVYSKTTTGQFFSALVNLDNLAETEYADIVDWYNTNLQLLEAKNTLNEIRSYMGSLTKSQFIVTTIRSKGSSDVKIKAVKLRPPSDKSTYKDQIKQAFKSKISQIYDENTASLKPNQKTKLQQFKDQMDKAIGYMSPTEDKGAQYNMAMATLFSALKLSDIASLINLSNIERHRESIIELLVEFRDFEKKYPRLGESNTGTADKQIVTRTGETIEMYDDRLNEFFNSNNSALNKLTEAISADSRSIPKSPSVTGSSGRKVFVHHISNFAKQTLRGISQFFKFVKHAKQSVERFGDMPSFLNTPFFKNHNIFINGVSNIEDTNLEFESERDNFTKFFKKWHALGRKSYFTSVFSSFFLDKVSSYASDNSVPHYVQLGYTPSDKARPVGALVPVLKEEEIKTALVHTLEQLNSMPAELAQDVLGYVSPDKKVVNFSPIATALKLTNLTIAEVLESQENQERFLEAVLQEMAKEALELTDTLLLDAVRIPSDTNTAVFEKLLGEDPNKRLGELTNRATSPWQGLPKQSSKWNKEEKRHETTLTREELFPVVQLFVQNHFVNSYHLTQLFAMSPQFYKTGNKQVKRMGGTAGPKTLGTYAQEEFKAVVLKDSIRTKGEVQDQVKRLIFGEKELTEQEQSEWDLISRMFSDFDTSDAQAIITPKRLEEHKQAHGRGYRMGNIIKPMYFGIRIVHGIPVPFYAKISAFTLSDDLTNKYPRLRALRDRMDAEGISELYFDSGVKVGAPVRNNGGVTFDQFVNGELADNAIVTLKNSEYGMQLNPLASIDKLTSIFTQLLYLLNPNINNANVQHATDIYTALSLLYDTGYAKWSKEAADVTSLLKRTLGETLEDHKYLEMLEAGVSRNNPLLEKKALSTFVAAFKSMVTAVKFPGGKAQLQSDIGIEDIEMEAIVNGKKTIRKYKHKLGHVIDKKNRLVVEVVMPKGSLPKEIEDYIMRNSGRADYQSPLMFGFRIPSTEIHSAIAFKIVGIYDSKGTNSLIVPELVTGIMGSDFDADALFIARRPIVEESLALTPIESIKKITEFIVTLDNMLEKYYVDESTHDEAVKLSATISEVVMSEQRDPITRETLDDLTEEEKQVSQELALSILKPFLANNTHLETQSEKMKKFDKSAGFVLEAIDKGQPLAGENRQWIPSSTDSLALVQLIAMYRQNKRLAQMSADPTQQNIAQMYTDIEASLMSFAQEMIDIKAGNRQGEVEGIVKGDFIGLTKAAKEGQLKGTFNNKFDKILLDKIKELEEYREQVLAEGFRRIAKVIDKEINKLTKIKQEFLKAVIVDRIIEVITSPKNRSRMLKPISKLFFVEESEDGYAEGSVFKELQDLGLLDTKEFDLSSPLGAWGSLRSISDGLKLIGIYANYVKVYGYIARSGPSSVQREYLDELGEYGNLLTQLANLESRKEVAAFYKKHNITSRQQLLDKIKNTTAKLRTQATFESVNAMPTLQEKHQFKYKAKGQEAKDYNTLENTSADGIAVLDLLDSLINIAIDNVNDQILPAINAFGPTATILPSLISIGTPLIDSVIMLKLPFVSDLLADPSVTNQDKLVGKLQQLRKKLKEKYVFEEEVTLSYEDLTDFITRETPLTKAAISKMAPSNTNIKEAAKVDAILNILISMGNVGSGMSELSSALAVLRDIPTDAGNIDRLEAVVNKFLQDTDIFSAVSEETGEFSQQRTRNPWMILDTTFPFDIPNFLVKNPHVSAAFQAFLSLTDKIRRVFIAHSEELRKAARNIPLKLEQREHSNNAAIRREIIKYVSVQVLNEGNIGFDINTQTAMTKMFPRSSKFVTVYGTSAFKANFVTALSKAIDLYREERGQSIPQIPFLDNVAVIDGRVQFTSGNLLALPEIMHLQDSFMQLRNFNVTFKEGAGTPTEVSYTPNTTIQGYTDFQKMFLYYSVLEYGFDFSPANFSYVLPPSLYSDFTDNLNEAFNTIKKNPRFFASALEKIKVQLLQENASKLSARVRVGDEITLYNQEELSEEDNLTKYKHARGMLEKDGVEIYFDRGYVVDDSKTEKELDELFPEYISVGEDTSARVFRKIISIPHPSLESKLIVMYQDMGYSEGSYTISHDFFTSRKPYNINENFNYGIKTLYVSDLNADAYITRANLDYLVGKTIEIVHATDKTKSNVFLANIVSTAPETKTIIKDGAEVEAPTGKTVYTLEYLDIKSDTSNTNPAEIFAYTDAAVVGLDADGKIIYLTPEALKLDLGLTIGASFSTLRSKAIVRNIHFTKKC